MRESLRCRQQVPRVCRLRAAVLASTLAAGMLFSGAAEAQLRAGALDLQVFRPAIDSKGFITLNASQILAPKDFSFGLVTTWARRPLFLEGGPNETFDVENLITPTLVEPEM